MSVTFFGEATGPGKSIHQPGIHSGTAGTRGEDQHGREKGRYHDNTFVERLWRTVKYEEVCLKAYANSSEARRELDAYFRFFNNRRPHQALGYRTPAEVFHPAKNATWNRSKVTEVHRNGCWYHWHEQRDSRLIPPRPCPTDGSTSHLTTRLHRSYLYLPNSSHCCWRIVPVEDLAVKLGFLVTPLS